MLANLEMQKDPCLYGANNNLVSFMRENDLAKAVRALLRMRGVPHGPIPKPTKSDLERKFVMRVDRYGKSTIKEV